MVHSTVASVCARLVRTWTCGNAWPQPYDSMALIARGITSTSRLKQSAKYRSASRRTSFSGWRMASLIFASCNRILLLLGAFGFLNHSQVQAVTDSPPLPSERWLRAADWPSLRVVVKLPSAGGERRGTSVRYRSVQDKVFYT